ncbi:MAG: hypothetical protein ACO0C9_07115 [Candidatus Methanosuratincola verstraetei]|jgi:hypothetical protein
MSEDEYASALRRIEGIISVKELTEEEKSEVLKLEEQAEKGVLMGLCRGINIGVREALKKAKVFACATDRCFKWPQSSYIKIVCGEEVIGEDVNEQQRLERLKCEGNIVAGTLVFYRDKMRLFKDRRDETMVQILPLEMGEILGKKVVVGSPSPPADLFLKSRMGIDTGCTGLGTVLIGIDA